jgi:hypothetical protein
VHLKSMPFPDEQEHDSVTRSEWNAAASITIHIGACAHDAGNYLRYLYASTTTTTTTTSRSS